MAKYASQGAGHPNLREADSMEELQHCLLEVPFAAGNLTIFCCPEGRTCSQPGCMEGRLMCTQCGLPLCRECQPYLESHAPRIPPVCLGNDMVVFYAPRMLYALMSATTLEMICASVCISSMVCFTLEMKYRNQQAQGSPVHLYEWSVHMAGRGVGS